MIRTDSCHGGATLMEDQTLEVAGEIGQPDLRLDPLQADGADEQAHAVLLVSEDMLDGCADR